MLRFSKKFGRLEEAAELYNRSLGITERVLGREHPQSAILFNNLAGLMAKKGDTSKALEFYDMGLSVMKRVFGANHKNTLIVQANRNSLVHETPNKKIQRTQKTRR